MLLRHGLDAEDRQIALGMNLPYLFEYNDGIYSSGSMLQTANHFNLYLNTLGFSMTETAVKSRDLLDYLRKCSTAMIGLKITQTEKHAVVYSEIEGDRFVFINNKHENSSEPERLLLTEKELIERLDDIVIVATIEKSPISTPNFEDLFLRSLLVLEQYKLDIQNFCQAIKTKDELVLEMNTLFRTTLLDGITMLELIDQKELAEQFRRIQKDFLATIKNGESVVLSEKLDMSSWLSAIDKYIALIKDKQNENLL